MGMILGVGLFGGVLVGALVSVVLGVLAIVVTRRASQERLNVWPLFVAGFVVCVSALLWVIPSYPFAYLMPGADYDVALKHFFLKGFFYSASPGVAAMLALLSARLGRRKQRES